MAKIYRVIQIKLDQFGLSKCSYYHRLTNKAYLSAVTVTNISRSFLPTRWRQKSTGIYGTKLRHCHPILHVTFRRAARLRLQSDVTETRTSTGRCKACCDWCRPPWWDCSSRLSTTSRTPSQRSSLARMSAVRHPLHLLTYHHHHHHDSLPEHVVSASTLQSFKRHLKTFLLQQSFRLAL